MAPPRNDELRAKIRTRYRELKSLGAKFRSETLRTEFGLPDWKLQYYLREQGVDRRRRYSKTALKKLSLDDEQSLAIEAEKHSTTPANLRRAAERAQGTTAPAKSKRREITARGYFDWNKTGEAKELGIHSATISNARQTLRVRFGLYLDKPNLLAHRKSGKVCRLVLKEQRLLLSDPAGYVVRHAREIARRWETVSLDEALKREAQNGTANE